MFFLNVEKLYKSKNWTKFFLHFLVVHLRGNTNKCENENLR